MLTYSQNDPIWAFWEDANAPDVGRPIFLNLRGRRKERVMHIVFSSYGNDSVALIQLLYETLESPDVCVLYSDTGWAAQDWGERVERMEDWVRGLGFRPCRTESVGLEELVKQRMGWPRQGMQFCTLELKIRPALGWLDANDPDKLAICCVGVRREESFNRRSYPEWTLASANHGDRALWAPLVHYTTQQRDILLGRAGVEPLQTRSMECFPCINSNRRDLRELAKDPERIERVLRIEGELGVTRKGKRRVMFRPYHYMGATGIKEVVRWAENDWGKYTPDDVNECDTGFCSG
jgi:3'-phosphoadenosine 5'-phosphosulfate sulfotransferase (PAPS reductase)/FAD synthetase